MRVFITSIIFILAAFCAVADNPYTRTSKNRQGEQIILRDGTILNVKVYQITQNTVRFNNKTNDVEKDELPLSDIYLIKSDKRGNLFFTTGGKRKTGETSAFDNKATIIYTTDYREIPIYSLEYDDDKLIYTTSKADRKNPQPLKKILPQSLAFIILYPDGSIDIINDMSKEMVYQPQAEPEAAQEREEEPLKVIFHTVKQGDTLNSVSERYSVKTSDIREWNEIGQKIKDTTPLKPGQQLMIYVKNVD